MSLREEIKQIIHNNVQGNETGLFGVDEATDEIISKIEKRIDKIIEENQISMDYYKNKDLAVQGRSIRDVAYGQDLILKQVLEMLK